MNRETKEVLVVLSQTELSAKKRMQKLTEELRKTIGAKNCIFTVEEIRGKKFFVLVGGAPKDQYDIGYKVSFENHLALQKSLQEKSFLLINVENTSLLNNAQKRWEKGAGVKKLFLAPITFREEVLGVIVVDILEGQKITKKEKDFVINVSSQVAWAIKNAFLYEELEESREELAQAVRLATLGREIAVLAHDLRNLIVAAGGWASLLLDETGKDDPRLPVIKKVQGTIIRAEKWLDNHLRFIKGEMSIKEISLTKFFRERLAKFNMNDVELIMDKSTSLIMADPIQLERVFFNLLKNAQEATGRRGRIWISLKEEKDSAIVEVGNESLGKPIPEEKIEHIFKPFFTSKKEGTGLGLAIVYRILTMIDGTIEVKSDEKETIFRIKIPLLNP